MSDEIASPTSVATAGTPGRGAAPQTGRGFGVDIGGSGVKGAPVDLATGELLDERYRIPTPQPATPEAVAEAVAEVCAHFEWTGPLGCTVPAVVTSGVARSAANIDKSWIGTDVEALLRKATGASAVAAVNDADAAGVAEVAYGAAKGRGGVVIVLTLGTGIGSALVVDGVLVPNTELGHLEIDGHDAEKRAADSAREREDLSWKDWAARLDRYLKHVEMLFSPSLFVLGGGVSKKSEKFLPLLSLDTPVIPAELRNNAGIAGAALLAAGRG
ncbi:polyphosphate--glucose phosphotransferase [Motilibacter deserti]|uniref:ROK family protein n=1 Tax=Motilibacter deserti TaxID=2714956 RepID=A0ABX0GUJ6_9ACTN|nr:ROK family protein [Motilibacter deserti]NHC13337.1 ROK family protein [Motilibacter deserti]